MLNSARSVSVPPIKIAAPRLRWFMIGLVFWATMINYMDRQTLSVVAPVLRDEFHMSNLSYARIVSAFMLAYTVMNGVSGPLIDRLGTRLGYALCVAWWSVAAMLHAVASGPVGFGAFRFLLGMGEAGNWPAGVRVVPPSGFLCARERSRPAYSIAVRHSELWWLRL